VVNIVSHYFSNFLFVVKVFNQWLEWLLVEVCKKTETEKTELKTG